MLPASSAMLEDETAMHSIPLALSASPLQHLQQVISHGCLNPVKVHITHCSRKHAIGRRYAHQICVCFNASGRSTAASQTANFLLVSREFCQKRLQVQYKVQDVLSLHCRRVRTSPLILPRSSATISLSALAPWASGPELLRSKVRSFISLF